MPLGHVGTVAFSRRDWVALLVTNTSCRLQQQWKHQPAHRGGHGGEKELTALGAPARSCRARPRRFLSEVSAVA